MTESSRDAATVGGIILASGTGLLAAKGLIPGWGFVVCVLLAAFLIYPARVGKFLKDLKDLAQIRGD